MNLSDDTQDKLQACLNQTWAESDYNAAKQQEIGLAVLDLYSFEHPQASERIAATLPAAPRCVLKFDEMLSNEPQQKLHTVVLLSDPRPDVAMPRGHIAACKRWYEALSEVDKLIAVEIVRTFNSGHEVKALSMAAALPAAPRL